MLCNEKLPPQGASYYARLLHPSLVAGLVPDEAEEADSHLHLRPTQRVPGGAAAEAHRGSHRAQDAAAHPPEHRGRAARPRTQMRRRWVGKKRSDAPLGKNVRLAPGGVRRGLNIHVLLENPTPKGP